MSLQRNIKPRYFTTWLWLLEVRNYCLPHPIRGLWASWEPGPDHYHWTLGCTYPAAPMGSPSRLRQASGQVLADSGIKPWDQATLPND